MCTATGPADPRKRPGAGTGRQGLLASLDPGGVAPPRIAFTSPERSDQIARRRRERLTRRSAAGLRSRALARRNVVERCFNRLKQFRDLATRYAKRPA